MSDSAFSKPKPMFGIAAAGRTSEYVSDKLAIDVSDKGESSKKSLVSMSSALLDDMWVCLSETRSILRSKFKGREVSLF